MIQMDGQTLVLEKPELNGTGPHKRRIGVSVLSTGIHMLRGPMHVADKAHEAGLDGIQLSPVSFWTPKMLESLDRHQVLSLKGDLRPHHFEPHFSNIKGKLLNRVLFGDRAHVCDMTIACRELFPDAVFVDTVNTIYPCAIELSPNHPYNASKYLTHSEGVVIDHRLREEALRRKENNPLRHENVYALTDKLIKENRVRLIHVQPVNRAQLNHFLKRGRGKLSGFLSQFRNVDVDVIIEVHPLWIMSNPVKNIRLFGKRIREFLYTSPKI